MAEIRSCLETLKEIRRGEMVTDLSVELHDLVAAVRATGKRGKVTLSITIKPASAGDVNLLMLEDDIKVTLPKSSKAATALYATDDNVLQRKDPRQPELTGLRSVAQVTSIEDGKAATV